MTRRLPTCAALALLGVLGSPAGARSYWTQGPFWADGNIVMDLELGSSGTLIDGSASWDESAEHALAFWNQYLDRVSFRVVRNSTAPVGLGNGRSNVFWASSVYGKDFDDFASPTQRNGIIAVTTSWMIGGRRTEADVIFRNTLSWNSYRGPIRRASNGGNLQDLYRTSLHEFGHVLGLMHPNDFGQNVNAIMNSTIGNLDTLTADDITGVQALYSIGGNGTVAFPPRNEALDFRNQLESKYANGLRRPAGLSYVDTEGDIVWTAEYFRYRVNACSHESAIFRVMNQIDGKGILGVCGSAAAGQVNFPPRNEALEFRTRLEAKYRDELGSRPTATAVDNEGDVVWTQEYLRYRVNGCTHGDSVNKVLLQIDGRGIQPVCR